MKKTVFSSLLGGIFLVTSGIAHAVPIYSYSDASPGQNSNGGKLSDLETSFDSGEEKFSWSYTVEGPTANPHNGFWLVVNDGGNPKGSDRNLAILYGDLINEDVTAYVYDGNNNPGSWQSSTFLESFQDVIDVVDLGSNRHEVSFMIDVTDINNTLFNPAPIEPWEGVAFGDQLGIWFHSTSGSGAVATYNSDGSILGFQSGASGWIDTGALVTTKVPEPGILYLTALGLCAFGASRRLKRKL